LQQSPGLGWFDRMGGGRVRGEDEIMADVVCATEHYVTVRIPAYVTDALIRWAESAEYPKGAPVWVEDGELCVDLRTPGQKDLRSYWTERQKKERERTPKA
jgi:hypothetical protein